MIQFRLFSSNSHLSNRLEVDAVSSSCSPAAIEVVGTGDGEEVVVEGGDVVEGDGTLDDTVIASERTKVDPYSSESASDFK